MFKFDFDIDDEEQNRRCDTPALNELAQQKIEQPFTEISLTQLLDTLPTLISYSPLTIPLSRASAEGIESVTLARRDLFDARFQLISDGAGDELGPKENSVKDRTQALGFLDAPFDLVPGVYEGGLKTWECSLDLVGYLDASGNTSVRGKRVLEIGCGTAVPTLYLLQQLFSAPPAYPKISDEIQETHIHVQDYNASVLELVTLPNIILAWYMSPASTSYRASLPVVSPSADEEHPSTDPSTPSNLPLPPLLKSAFQNSLADHNIHLRFFSGSWEGFNPCLTGGSYNLVLTSETIYRPDGLNALIKLLKAACGCQAQSEGDIIHELAQQNLSHNPTSSEHQQQQLHEYLCLVASKVLYFGVGGSVSDFTRVVEGSQAAKKGKVEILWEKRVGVGRCVMRIQWN